MRMVGIVQARMSSNRLPGKSLRRLGGESVLARVLRTVGAAEVLDQVIVATSTGPEDDPIAEEGAASGVVVHRGPLDDVLARFAGALEAHPAEAVMRFTADCPLLDPRLIRRAAEVWRASPGLDYLSTALNRTLPRGTDVEIASAAALWVADREATGHHRQHVTSYLYANPDRFAVMGLTFAPDLSDLRVTLDTAADWEVIHRVHAVFGDALPSVGEVARWLRAHPEVVALNADVVQKPLEDG
jgi:spore coat polysaccharide biosynthesis protein SpsF